MELKILKAEYKLLSRLEDEFAKGSKHKAYKLIQSKMDIVLEKIDRIKAVNRVTNKF